MTIRKTLLAYDVRPPNNHCWKWKILTTGFARKYLQHNFNLLRLNLTNKKSEVRITSQHCLQGLNVNY